MKAALRRTFSLLTRRRKIKIYLRSHKTRKLQIGSGVNILKGWFNTDLNPTKEIVFLNVKRRLPFDDRTFDYVFSEHLIEHLNYREGEFLLRECFRILKPSGKIRLATPDLRFLIELCASEKTELQKRYITWAVDLFLPNIRIYQDTFVINNFFQTWGHKFIYDFKTLQDALNRAGFIDVACYNVGESNDINLQNLESHGKHITDEFNKLETMVAEAIRPA